MPQCAERPVSAPRALDPRVRLLIDSRTLGHSPCPLPHSTRPGHSARRIQIMSLSTSDVHPMPITGVSVDAWRLLRSLEGRGFILAALNERLLVGPRERLTHADDRAIRLR